MSPVASGAVIAGSTASSLVSPGLAPGVRPAQSTSPTAVLPRLVIGAEKDYIVDIAGVLETGQYLGVEPVFIPGLYHEVMLGPKWNLTAFAIGRWLDSVI